MPPPGSAGGDVVSSFLAGETDSDDTERTR
jgi:hypothetical protein